ncbi:Short chain dehydrogenase, partial [Globisporangium splendens]
MAVPEKKTVLIAGSTRGLGLKFAEKYIELGWNVIGTARDLQNAEQLRALSPYKIVQLDSVDEESIAKAAEHLADESVDLLINNAAIAINGDLASTTKHDMLKQFEVNSLGPFLVTRAFLPHLKSAVAKNGVASVVQMSSQAGSIQQSNGSIYGYRMSKAALNMANATLASDLKHDKIGAFVVHPGFVKTDMTKGIDEIIIDGMVIRPISTEESVSGLIRVIDTFSLADSGKFVDYTGESIPCENKHDNWVQWADSELQQLEVSKALNCKLKCALSKLQELSTTFQSAFEKQVMLKEELDLFESEPRADIPDDIRTFVALHHYLDKFYCKMDTTIAPINSKNANFVVSSNHVRQDPTCGRVVEFVTNAPLSTPLHQVDSHSDPLFACFAHTCLLFFADAQKLKSNLEMQYKSSFIGDVGHILVNGASAVCKIEELDRTIMLFTSVLEEAGTGITFREDCCIIMSGTLNNSVVSDLPPTSMTKFRTFCRIYAETAPPRDDSARNGHARSLQEFILSAQIERTNACLLKLQDAFMHQLQAVQAEVDIFGSSSLAECIR